VVLLRVGTPNPPPPSSRPTTIRMIPKRI
jgi:hypothetical protein